MAVDTSNLSMVLIAALAEMTLSLMPDTEKTYTLELTKPQLDIVSQALALYEAEAIKRGVDVTLQDEYMSAFWKVSDVLDRYYDTF